MTPWFRFWKHALSISIAAASVVAKVYRDALMQTYDQLHPGFGIAQHTGYGTVAHLAALNLLGPTPFHRMSFRPVREVAALFRTSGSCGLETRAPDRIELPETDDALDGAWKQQVEQKLNSKYLIPAA